MDDFRDAAAKANAVLTIPDWEQTPEAVEAAIKNAIAKANKALDQDPALVNRDPYGKGWMVKVKLKDPKELEGLLRADAYAKHVGE